MPHGYTATQQRTLTTTHCRQRRSESNIHTDTQTHSTTATHTATLHSQRARHHGSNSQRRRGVAHPPTTASSNVQRSHSRRHTQHFHHGVTVSSATLRLRHARSQDTCRTSARYGLPAIAADAATLNTRATPLPHCNAAVAHACTQRTEAHTDEQSTANTIPRSAAPSHSSHSETRCSDAHATIQSRNRNTAAQHPTHCARDSAGAARPRRAFYIVRMTQPRCFTLSQAQCTPHAHVD